MKKILLLFILVLCGTFTSNAQKEKGFGAKFELGYGLGLRTQDKNVFSINAIPVYHINRRWTLGLGVGYRNISFGKVANYDFGSLSLIPVFIHAQWNIIPTAKVVPYLSYREGFVFGSKTLKVFDIWDKIEGRLLSSIELGCKFKIQQSSAISLGILFEALLCHETTNDKYNNDYYSSNGSITFRAGFEF